DPPRGSGSLHCQDADRRREASLPKAEMRAPGRRRTCPARAPGPLYWGLSTAWEGDAVDAREHQLLTVWNPYFEPETIQLHVELLRQHGKVWWARLYRGQPIDTEAARAKYAHVAEIWPPS